MEKTNKGKIIEKKNKGNNVSLKFQSEQSVSSEFLSEKSHSNVFFDCSKVCPNSFSFFTTKGKCTIEKRHR